MMTLTGVYAVPPSHALGYALPFGHGLMYALGWTLLHFCWQGAAVAGLLWCLLALIGERAARVRYGVACAALLLMAALPLVTFVRLAAAEPRNAAAVGLPAFTLDVTADGSEAPRQPLRLRIAAGLDTAAAWIPAVWGVGLVLFLGRLNCGLIVAGRIKSRGTEAAPAEMLRTLAELRVRLGVACAVRLAQSAMVEVPTVIGWLRPMVLVPVGCFVGLSAAQVEALLAHELAHIRRHDYLVSVLQSVVEALLFYHPAVWWVSRQVRRERECCCDELAVEVSGDVLAYARALASLEEWRGATPALVLSAKGGVLTMRIKRLLGSKEGSAASQVAAFLILGVVIAVGGSYVAAVARAQGKAVHAAIAPGAQEQPVVASELPGEIAFVAPPAPFGPVAVEAPVGQDTAATMKPQYRIWLNQDVSWIITPQEREAFLRLANDGERDDFIRNFWARRDPPGAAPNTYRSEHYARMAYANEHFATDHPGWKSDRGHVYIAYGKPESIDAHPGGGPGGYPFEVWHYPSIPGIGDNVDVHFTDTCACGDYRYTVDLPGQPAQGPSAGNGQSGQAARVALASRLLGAAGSGSGGQVMGGPSGDKAAQGTISGIIADPTGALVPRASVKAVSAEAGVSVTKTTDNSGTYSFAVPAGGYSVEVRAPGFQRLLQENVQVDAGRTVGLNLRLRLGVASESLTVDAAPAPPPSPPEQTFEPAPPVAGRPARISAGVMAGNAMSQPAPVYPAAAKAAHVQGVVVLHALISKTGTVEDLNVISGPPALIVSAIDAVRQWRYKPYLLNGEPTAVETTINVNYTLSEAAQASADVMQSNLVSKVQPVYPAEAKAARVQGTVVLKAIVSKDGVPVNLQVVSGPPELGGSALDAVKQWRYKPYLLNGQPTEVETTIEVHFSLEGSAQMEKPGGVVRMKDGAIAPVVLTAGEPEYTERARKAKTSGVVVVRLIVDQKGMPTQVHLVRGVGNGLDKKAIEAVKQYRFKPAIKDGKPVEEAMNVEVNFQIF